MYYIFGSGDSTDVDIVQIVKQLPTLEECREINKKNNNKDTNFAVIKNNRITQCNIGTPDELHNAIIDTYHLHTQEFPLFTNIRVERDVMLKQIRVVRYLLSILSRTEKYHSIARQAMRSTDWQQKLNIIQNINYATIETFNKTQSNTYIRKKMAFQLGQAIALIDDIELYTKQSIVEYYPNLQPFLYHKNNGDLSILNLYKNKLINKLKDIPFTHDGDVVTFDNKYSYNLKYETRVKI